MPLSPVTVAEKRAILRTFYTVSKLLWNLVEIIYFGINKKVYHFKKCAPPFKAPRMGV